MKVTSMNCPNCNSPLQVKEGQKTITCEYCGSHLGIDDGTLKLDVSLTNSEEAGYQFEKGRSALKQSKVLAWLPLRLKFSQRKNAKHGYGYSAGFVFFRSRSPY